MDVENRTQSCINCAQPFSTTNIKVANVTCFIFDRNDNSLLVKENTVENSVESILMSIYNLQDELNLVGACCIRCAAVLTRLYQYYIEFNQLRQLESVLSDVIRKSNKCVTTIIERQTEVEGQSSLDDNLGTPLASPSQNFFSSYNYDDGSSSHNINNSSTDNHPQELVQNVTRPPPPSSLQINFDPQVILDRLTPKALKRAGVSVNETAAAAKTETTSKECFSSRKVSRKSKTTHRSSQQQQHPLEIQLVADVKEEVEAEGDDGESLFDPDDQQNGDDDGNNSDFKLNPDKNFEERGTSDSPSATPSKTANKTVLDVSSTDTTTILPRKKHLSCTTCQKKFSTEQGLDRHLMKQHSQNPFTCVSCGLLFVKRRELKAHFKQNHAVPSICSDCGKSFSTKTKMKEHYLKVHQDNHYCCTVCPEKFRQSEQLREHFSSAHPGESVFLCTICPRSFQSEARLTVHLKYHDMPKVSHSCHICGRSFHRKSSLTAHLDVHKGLKEHLCPHCGIKLRCERNLQLHLLIHTNQKPHQCNVCHKFFRHLSGLRRHEEAHDGQSYLCAVCGKSYGKKSNLLNHSKLHSADRPFVCPVVGCDKAFKISKYLSVHARVHAEGGAEKRK